MFLWLRRRRPPRGSKWMAAAVAAKMPSGRSVGRVGDAVVPPGASASAAEDLGVLGEEHAEEYKTASR